MNVYVRRRIPGEFGARDGEWPQAAYVEVEQVFPGYCRRQAIQVLRGREYPTGTIPNEHAEALIDYALGTGGAWRLIENDEIDPADD